MVTVDEVEREPEQGPTREAGGAGHVNNVASLDHSQFGQAISFISRHVWRSRVRAANIEAQQAVSCPHRHARHALPSCHVGLESRLKGKVT